MQATYMNDELSVNETEMDQECFLTQTGFKSGLENEDPDYNYGMFGDASS